MWPLCMAVQKVDCLSHCCHHCWNSLPTHSANIHCLVSINIQQILMSINGYKFFHVEEFNYTHLLHIHFHVRCHGTSTCTSMSLSYILFIVGDRRTVHYTRSPSKVMPPTLLSWPTTAEVGDMAVKVEPSHQYSFSFCCVTDGCRGAVWPNDVQHGSEHEEMTSQLRFRNL